MSIETLERTSTSAKEVRLVRLSPRSRGADRRAAILSTLAGCTDEELPLLVDLMLEPIRGVRSVQEGTFKITLVSEGVSEKQQVGFLRLLGDVLKHLGSRLVSRWPVLLETLLDLIGGAQSTLDAQKAKGDVVEEDTEEDPVVEEDEEEDTRPFRRDVAVGREVLDLVGRQVGHRRHVVGDGRDDAQSSRNTRIR